MAYLSHFYEVDLLITQLAPTILTITDDMVKANFAGMLSVRAVTAYELAVKDIFIDFSRKKHKVFGTYVDSSLSRLNGKVGYQDIQNFVKKYGSKYLDKFKNEVGKFSSALLESSHVDLLSSYDNLIKGRHSFVHQGTVILSWEETRNNYVIGKQVIEALNNAMKR